MSKTKFVTCPCCNQAKHKTEIKAAIKSLNGLLKKNLSHYYGNGKDLFPEFNTGRDFEWACDQCIDNDLAEPSNPELQTSIDWRPYLAFFDSERYCEQCNKSYIFSRKEKRFWYEELQFWVQSKPKHCKVCRKEVREKKQINKKLSDLIKRFDELTISELEEIVDCYKKMGKTEKMKYYQSVVNRERKNKK